jgi:hypothetical protein
MKDPQTHGFMKGGPNDLEGVLHIRQQNGVTVRHVNSLKVIGDEDADFNFFTMNFGKNDGTETDDDLEARYLKLKPYNRLSWIVFPDVQQRVDPNDEKFIKFAISRSMGAMRLGGRYAGKDSAGFYGFESIKQEPKYVMTSPVWIPASALY